MCFGGGSSNRDETVIIKNRVRPRPSYDEKIYISEPRNRRAPRYESDRRTNEQDLTLIRSRRDQVRRSGEYYSEPVARRSNTRYVEEESRKVSRHSYR